MGSRAVARHSRCARITQDDLRGPSIASISCPNNMILGIVGDISSDEAFAMAEKRYSALAPWGRAGVEAGSTHRRRPVAS